MRDALKRNIHGVDVENGFVGICSGLFESRNFSACQVMPPLKSADSTMNLISAYPVFSHLSEVAFTAWLHEFGRILKPGGIIAFTTRTEGFMDYCTSLDSSRSELSGYQLVLATAAGGDAGLRKKYHAGGSVFVSDHGVSGGGAMNESFYGEAFISRPYTQKHLGASSKQLISSHLAECAIKLFSC